MKSILLVLLIIHFNLSFGQKESDYLIAFSDTTSGQDLIGYKSLHGKVCIQAKYEFGPDTLYTMAIVLTTEYKYIGINRYDSILLIPYMYDNGPDYIEEGLFRFIDSNKIGFANVDGNKIIPAEYDFATPFSEGLSGYFIGGERVYENGKTEKEILKESGYLGLVDLHWTWGGAITETGYLNKKNQTFYKISALKNNKREAWSTDNKHYKLNKNGDIIKIFKK